jgi:F0F1-type ATP synthase assembly protein I
MRIVYFLLLVVASVIFPWWLVLPLFGLSAFVCGAYELIVLGILLDAYFGSESFFSVFHLSVAVIACLVAAFLKPRVTLCDAGL